MHTTCNVSSCNNVLFDIRELRPRIREMNVFCRQPLPFLQGTMQAVSRLPSWTLSNNSAEPSNQTFNRLELWQEEEEEGAGRERAGMGGRGEELAKMDWKEGKGAQKRMSENFWDAEEGWVVGYLA